MNLFPSDTQTYYVPLDQTWDRFGFRIVFHFLADYFDFIYIHFMTERELFRKNDGDNDNANAYKSVCCITQNVFTSHQSPVKSYSQVDHGPSACYKYEYETNTAPHI